MVERGKVSVIDDLIQEGFISSVEHIYLAKDGMGIPVSLSSSVMRIIENAIDVVTMDASGQITGWNPQDCLRGVQSGGSRTARVDHNYSSAIPRLSRGWPGEFPVWGKGVMGRVY